MTLELFGGFCRRSMRSSKAGNRDVHDDSKPTTLPVAREIVDVYVRDSVKLPWYIDLLNITLGTSDLQKAKSRIGLLAESFRKDGTG